VGARKRATLSREIRLRGQTKELMYALKQLALRDGIDRVHFLSIA